MKKVLIIMSTFAPFNSCGSIPNTKLVKYLARQDVQITLLANEPLPYEPQDETLLPKEMERIRTFRVGQSPFFMKTLGSTQKKITDSGTKEKMKSARKPLQYWIVSQLKNIYITSRTRDWTKNAIRILRRNLKNEHFDVIYSSYPSYQTHLVARYAKKHGMADAWVADFRDPMGYMGFDKYGYRRSIRRQRRVERWADRVTVVSEGALEKFRFPEIPEQKLCYLPNGYDPEDFSVSSCAQTDNGGVLRFFYAGTLYEGRRDMQAMFRALSELIAEGCVDPERVSVEYAGSEFSVLCGCAKRFGLADQCKDYGYVPRRRVMEIMEKIDVTLVCSLNTEADRGVVTGKVFELLLVEKPILTIVNGTLPDSELGRIVRECSAGVVYEEANDETDYPVLKQWIREAYETKQKDGFVPVTIERSRREQYSYDHIAKKLTSILLGAAAE